MKKELPNFYSTYTVKDLVKSIGSLKNKTKKILPKSDYIVDKSPDKK